MLILASFSFLHFATSPFQFTLYFFSCFLRTSHWHANSNGMLNVYLRSKGFQVAWRDTGQWPQLFCRILHIANGQRTTCAAARQNNLDATLQSPSLRSQHLLPAKICTTLKLTEPCRGPNFLLLNL